jgi:hydroxylaminobenzene mutase
MATMALSREGRAIAITGAVLFLAGLVQGAFVDAFANPRMALSAHLDAVQSGMALMLAGLLWAFAFSHGKAEAIARWTLCTGMTGLWVGITLAALTGASEALPMAELAVSAIVPACAVLLTAGWALFLFGLIRSR